MKRLFYYLFVIFIASIIISCSKKEELVLSNGYYAKNITKYNGQRTAKLYDSKNHNLKYYKYNSIRQLTKDLYIVEQDEKYGILEIKQKPIEKQPCIYDTVRMYSENTIITILQNEEHISLSLLDLSLKSVLPDSSYESITTMNDGYIYCEKNNLYGICRSNYTTLLPCEFQSIKKIGDDKFSVKQNGLYGLVDSTGSFLIPCVASIVSYDDPNPNIYVKDEGYYFLNSKWQVIDRNAYNYKVEAKASSSIIVAKSKGHYGFVNSIGSVVIPFIYDSYDFSLGLFKVKKNGKWGIIDESGKVIIDCIYEKMSSPVFSDIMINGVRTKWLVAKNGKKWHILTFETSNGELVSNVTVECDEMMEPCERPAFGIRRGNKWGVCDDEGKILVPCIYDGIGNGCFINSTTTLAPVKKSGKWGYININNNQVTNDFIYDEATQVFCPGNYSFVKKNGMWSIMLLDYENKLIEAKKDLKNMVFNNNGQACFETEGKKAYIKILDFAINPNGIDVIIEYAPEGTDFLEPLSPNSYYFRQDGKYGIIFKEGGIKDEATFDELVPNHKKNFVVFKREGMYGVLQVQNNNREKSRVVKSGLSQKPADIEDSNVFGIKNEKFGFTLYSCLYGSQVFPINYDIKSPFVNDLALISFHSIDNNTRYGFINNRGEIIFGPFRDAHPYENGKALVRLDEDHQAYISPQGKVLEIIDETREHIRENNLNYWQSAIDQMEREKRSNAEAAIIQYTNAELYNEYLNR